MEEKKYPIIKIDALLEYRDCEVYIKKIVTNEMPAILLFKIIDGMSENIKEFYKWNFTIKKKKED